MAKIDFQPIIDFQESIDFHPTAGGITSLPVQDEAITFDDIDAVTQAAPKITQDEWDRYKAAIPQQRKFAGFWDELGRNIAGGTLRVGSGLLSSLAEASQSAIWNPETIERAAASLRNKAAAESLQPGEGGGVKGFVAQAVGQAIPYMGASTLATIATGTPLAAFSVGFSVEGDEAYRTALERGATEQQAQSERFLIGTINGAVETLQVSNLLKFGRAGKTSIRAITAAARQKAFKKLGKEFAKAGLSTLRISAQEGIEEALQEASMQLVPVAISGAPVPETGEFLERTGKAALGGAVAGPILGGAGAIAGRTDVADIPPITDIFRVPEAPPSQALTAPTLAPTEPTAVQPPAIIPEPTTAPAAAEEPTAIISKTLPVIPEGERQLGAIRLKDGTFVAVPFSQFKTHGHIVLDNDINPQDVESGGFITPDGYATQTNEADRLERVGLIKKGVKKLEKQVQEPQIDFVPEKPTPPPTPKAVEKQAFEMTLIEFGKSKLPPEQAAQITEARQVKNFLPQHRVEVKAALARGDSVPLRVLKEFKGEKFADDILEAQAPKPEITPSIGAARRGFETFDPAIKRALKSAKQLKKDFFIVQSPTIGKFSVRQVKPSKGNFTVVRPDDTFDLIKQASLRAEGAFDFGEKPFEPTKFLTETERVTEKLKDKAADAKSLRQEIRALSKVAPITADQKDVIITRLAKIGPERQAKTNIRDLQGVIADMGRFVKANDKKSAISSLKKMVATVQKKTRRGRQQFAKLRNVARERILEALEGVDLKQLTAAKRLRLERIDKTLEALGFTEAEKLEGAAAIEGTKRAKELERLEKQFVGEFTTAEIRQIEDAVRLAFLQDQLETNLMTEAEAATAEKIKVKAISETSDTRTVRRQALKEGPIKLRRKMAGLLTWAGRIPTKDSAHIYVLARTTSTSGSKTLENLVDVERHRGKVAGLARYFDVREAMQAQFKSIGWTAADRKRRREFHLVSIAGREFQMTTEDIMSLGMNLRDSENLVEIKRTKGLNVGGTRLPRPTISEIIDAEKNLTAKELAMMDWIMTMNVDHLQPMINETSVKLLGFDLAVRPDYWPIVRDVPRRVKGKVADAPAIEDAGPFQPRTGGTQVMKIRGFWDVMLQMQQQASSFHGNAIPMRNTRSLLNDPEWQNAMKDSGREREMENLLTMFRRIQGVSSDRGSAEQIASFILNRGARSILGGRLSTVLAQTGSLPMLFDFIPVKYASALSGFKPQTGKVQRERMNQFSPFVRMRDVGGRTNLVTGSAGTLSAVDMMIFDHTPLLDKPLTPMRKADRVVIVQADTYIQRWVADTTDLKVGSDEFYREVARRTDDATRKTQPMWDMDERSVLSSSPNILLRAALMFRAAREQMLNRALVAADAVAKSPGKESSIQLARTTVAVTASTVQVRLMKNALRLSLLAGATAILGAFGVKRHRKRILALQTLEDLGRDVALDTLGHLPFGTEIAAATNTIVRSAQAKPTFRRGNQTIIAGTFTLFVDSIVSLISAHRKLQKGEDAGVQLTRGLTDLVDAAARGAGLPFGGPVGQLVIQPLLTALSQPTDLEMQNKAFRLTSLKLPDQERKRLEDDLKAFGVTTKDQVREILAARRRRELIKRLQPKPRTLDSGRAAVAGEARALKGFE